jgi:hypothetical protein
MHVAAHLLVSVPHTVTAHPAVIAMSVLPTTVVSVPNAQHMVTAPNVHVMNAPSVPPMEIVLLVETVLPTVTVTNVLPTIVVSVPSVPHSTAAETDLLTVTAPSVLALIAMHHVASDPLTEIAHLAEIVPRMVTAMSAPHTTVASVPNAQLSTVENALNVLPTVTVTNVLRTTVVSVPSAPLSVIALLAEIAHRMVTATTVRHVTSAETALVTTRTKPLAVPLQTSTLQRTRRHASPLKRMSYSSASKHRQPLLLMLMA